MGISEIKFHETRWNNLTDRMMELFQMGSYKEATVLGEEALELAESTLDKHHPHLATSMVNLAVLYRTQGRMKKASELINRSLFIDERNLSVSPAA